MKHHMRWIRYGLCGTAGAYMSVAFVEGLLHLVIHYPITSGVVAVGVVGFFAGVVIGMSHESDRAVTKGENDGDAERI